MSTSIQCSNHHLCPDPFNLLRPWLTPVITPIQQIILNNAQAKVHKNQEGGLLSI
jgi:hypothetical protein